MKTNRTISKAIRQIVSKRAGERCEYCQSPLDHSPDPFSVEHILPRAEGGKDTLDNLAYSCQGCNNAKHIAIRGLDPVTGQIEPLYHPRLQP
ncbi:MAG: HNH endonuclease [Chthonomonadaceae bacterium]|nr:HNH endonuclease [Chthonomonadaceae bacterium]